MQTFEQNGDKFNLKTFLEARKLCIKATDEIISQISEGMREKEIKSLVEESFAKIGVEKFWHPTKIRIGADTMKTFRDLSDPDRACRKGDICFLDLGPIIQDHEADYGKTFIFGTEEKTPIIMACHEVFQKTAHKWKSEGLTGVELFNFAEDLTARLGYKLNPMMSGHRLGDFPHRIHSTAALFNIEDTPSPNLWVLEIHIRDEKNSQGAFTEDILLG